MEYIINMRQLMDKISVWTKDIVYALNDDKLRQLLIELGDSPGPIVASTRDFYRRRLIRRVSRSSDLDEPQLVPSSSSYVRSIVEGDFDFSVGNGLDRELSSFFADSGMKSYFNYLLIDPRGISPQTSIHIDMNRFDEFVKGIFYVGKGHGRRPFKHLEDAAANIRGAASDRVSEIWNMGYGVVSLHCFHNISSQEALTRESLMIKTIGLQNLTNIARGEDRARLLRWTESKKHMAGAMFLFKAFLIFCAEGDNQIKRRDIRF